jgi:hypothetical protein
MRIWDIVDKLQPGVEITQPTGKPVKFPSPVTTFTLSVAGFVLATASAFWLPVPRQLAIESATNYERSAPSPQLSFFGVPFSGLSDQNGELLDKIEIARGQTRSGHALRLDVLEANQQESLNQAPSFSRSQISAIVKKRRVG